MQFVQLLPLTNKAKNKINEAGHPARWLVLETRDNVVFSDKPGPWFHVVPENSNSENRFSRWVNLSADADFIVKEV